jgi:tetratricopeptide (TPR) repeat protein
MTTPSAPAPGSMSAQPPASTAARPPDHRPRRADLILARSHLRLGSLDLARAELETIAGLGFLDIAGLVDLAEVRWRTGDLPGAGEAAVAALGSSADDAVAFVIAAEAASADGRPGDARRLASQALERADGGIDRIFAGMPRASIWPPDADEPPPSAATLFHREATSGAAAGAAGAGTAEGATGSATAAAGGPGDATPSSAGKPGGAATVAAAGVAAGFWDDHTEGAAAAPALPDPDETFHAGRAALIAGDWEEAAFRFGMALRLAPALAPAVIEVTEGSRNIPLLMVRGDAYRVIGHEAEARAAYALAAQGGPPERRKRARISGPQGDLGSAADRAAVLDETATNETGTNGTAPDEPATNGTATLESVTPTTADAEVPAEPEATADSVTGSPPDGPTPA